MNKPIYSLNNVLDCLDTMGYGLNDQINMRSELVKSKLNL